MARYGPQFGPDITFLGVARCDWADPATFPGADVVILGAPFDRGTSYRSGARFGPRYIRQTCYLPHDGSRPSLALRADGGRRDHLGSGPAAAGWPVTWRPAGSAAPGRATEGDG